MLNKKSRVIALALGGMLTAAMTGCETSSIDWHANGMPRHEHPRQDWWNYQFVYHPGTQTYYEPYTRTYYWNDSGIWWKGSQLPPGYEHELDGSVARVIKVKTQSPHFHHPSALAYAGPAYGGYSASPYPDFGPGIAVTVADSDFP